MRTEEQIEFSYKAFLKACAKQKEKYEAGYDPYFYGLNYGAAFALGNVLGKTMPQIKRDLDRAERKFNKSS